MDVTLSGLIPARNDGAFTKCWNSLPTIGGGGLTIDGSHFRVVYRWQRTRALLLR